MISEQVDLRRPSAYTSHMTKRILIIEDEAPLREAFAMLLKAEGYEVELADNGKAGLQKINLFRPDLVLLDLLMPVMNGLEFLQATTGNKTKVGAKKSYYKTLVLSNLSDPISREEVKRYGVTRSVLKADLSPTQLAALVREILGAKE